MSLFVNQLSNSKGRSQSQEPSLELRLPMLMDNGKVYEILLTVTEESTTLNNVPGSTSSSERERIGEMVDTVMGLLMQQSEALGFTDLVQRKEVGSGMVDVD